MNCLGKELGVYVPVVEELSEPQLALVEHGDLTAVTAVNPYLGNRGRRDMYKTGACSETELDTAACSAYIDVLDVGALGVVLDIGGTVEDGID